MKKIIFFLCLTPFLAGCGILPPPDPTPSEYQPRRVKEKAVEIPIKKPENGERVPERFLQSGQ